MNDLSTWSQTPLGQIVVGLIGASIAYVLGRFFQPLLRKFWPDEHTQKNIVVGLFVFVLISIAFWFLYPESTVPKLATLGLLILAVTTWHYYYAAANQIGKAHVVLVGETRKIRVRMLKRIGLAPDEVLHITWNTIGKGAEYLLDQIKQHKPSFYPDLILGINELGMIVACYLAGTLQRSNRLFGVVWTGNADPVTGLRSTIYSIPQTVSTDRSQKLSILLVDGELKSGKSAKQIKDELEKTFNVSRILVATLVACRTAGPVEEMTKIRFVKGDGTQQNLAYLPDFLAFQTTGDMEPPGDIR